MEKMFLTAMTKEVNKEERTIVAWASRAVIDRDREVLPAGAWKWKEIQSGGGMKPKFLAFHDHKVPAIGRILWLKREADGMKFKAQFNESSMGKELWPLYRDGDMDSFSVGFIPDDGGWDDFPEAEKSAPKRVYKDNSCSLLEVSCVNIPSCPAAVVDTLTHAVETGKILEKEFIAVVKEMDALHTKPETTEDFHHIPIRSKNDFVPESFRTITVSAKDGIKATIGKLKADPQGPTKIQHYLFDVKKFSMDEAKKWVADHKEAKAYEDVIIDFLGLIPTDENGNLVVEKAGRTLSGTSRKVIQECLDKMLAASEALRSYLDGTDVPPETEVHNGEEGSFGNGGGKEGDLEIIVKADPPESCPPDKEGKCPEGYELGEDGVCHLEVEEPEEELEEDKSKAADLLPPDKAGNCPDGYELGTDKMCHLTPAEKGGEGSGNFGHSGRPRQVGGSGGSGEGSGEDSSGSTGGKVRSEIDKAASMEGRSSAHISGEKIDVVATLLGIEKGPNGEYSKVVGTFEYRSRTGIVEGKEVIALVDYRTAAANDISTQLGAQKSGTFVMFQKYAGGTMTPVTSIKEKQAMLAKLDKLSKKATDPMSDKPKESCSPDKDGKCPEGYEMGGDNQCHLMAPKKDEIPPAQKDFEIGELTEDEQVIFKLVDGDKIRIEQDEEFRIGGHHYIYDFIPENEIWIESRMLDEDILAAKVRNSTERQLMKYFGFTFEMADNASSVAEKITRHVTDEGEDGFHDERHIHVFSHGGNHKHVNGKTSEPIEDFDVSTQEKVVEDEGLEIEAKSELEVKMVEIDEAVVINMFKGVAKEMSEAMAAKASVLVDSSIKKAMGKAF